jgi:carbamoyltransferase
MGYVLGINCSGFLSSACLVGPEGIETAICEERLSRIKQDRSFPKKAISYTLAASGISLEEVQDVYVGWHPRFYLKQSDQTQKDAFRERGKISYLALNELATMVRSEIHDVSQVLSAGDSNIHIHFVDHHKAHLANAFHQSGFESADFLMLDGFGEVSTGLAGTVSGNAVDVFHSIRTPHSLGSYYSAFTQFLGFKVNSDEWKVMALAAQGDSRRYYDQVRSLVKVDGLGIELDLSFFEHFLFFTPNYYSDKFLKVFGAPLPQGEEPSERHCDIVAAAQRVAEEVVFELARNLSKRGAGRRLVVGGGFFMNSVCNGKLRDASPYDELFIGGSPDDSGISLGSALWGARQLGWRGLDRPLRHNFFGKQYSADESRAELGRRKLSYKKLDNPARTAAELLHHAKIIGWYQGRSEFGQRALGNRSILANPTRSDVKKILNATVKYREGFRPFAPAVLEERQKELFPDVGDQTSYFMEKVFKFQPDWSSRLPGVVHFDGSGRLQSVSRAINPLFHQLITEFERFAGVPVVLNTSFNTNGMPLVETPADAIGCFFDSGLDALILHDCLLAK